MPKSQSDLGAVSETGFEGVSSGQGLGVPGSRNVPHRNDC